MVEHPEPSGKAVDKVRHTCSAMAERCRSRVAALRRSAHLRHHPGRSRRRVRHAPVAPARAAEPAQHPQARRGRSHRPVDRSPASAQGRRHLGSGASDVFGCRPRRIRRLRREPDQSRGQRSRWPDGESDRADACRHHRPDPRLVRRRGLRPRIGMRSAHRG